MKIFQGQMPDVTPAQVIAVLLGGVPVIATLLHSFGIYDMTAQQQEALKNTLEWAGILAVGLFGADAGLRAARNSASARVMTAQLPKPSEPSTPPAPVPPAAVPLAPNDDLVGARTDLDPELPTDDEEFAGLAAFEEEQLGNGHSELEPELPTDEEEFADLDPDEDSGPESRLAAVAPDDEEDM